jgi:hypothetical protein
MAQCQQAFRDGGNLRPALRRRTVRVSWSRRPACLAEANGEGGNVRPLPSAVLAPGLPLLLSLSFVPPSAPRRSVPLSVLCTASGSGSLLCRLPAAPNPDQAPGARLLSVLLQISADAKPVAARTRRSLRLWRGGGGIGGATGSHQVAFSHLTWQAMGQSAPAGSGGSPLTSPSCPSHRT